MAFDQLAILVLLAAMMAGFAAIRRFEIVALVGLAIAGISGLVPGDEIFAGFTSPAAITVLEVLLIVSVLRRAAALDGLVDRIVRHAGSARTLTLLLCVLAALLSTVMNNIGALALMLPLAFGAGERLGVSPGRLMMPLSFATLLGGLGTVVGTPANLIGVGLVEEVRCTPFGFFELGLVGLPVMLAGLVYLCVATPPNPLATPVVARGRDVRRYVAELPAPAVRQSGVDIVNIVRNGAFVFGRDKAAVDGDIVIARTARSQLDRLLPPAPPRSRVDAAVMPESQFIGSAIGDLVGLSAHEIDIAAVGTTATRVEGRLADLRLSIGDVLVLDGEPATLRARCEDAGLLLLAPQHGEAAGRGGLVPVLLFAAGIIAAAVFAVPSVFAFGLVVIALALTGHLSLRQGLEEMNWSILILLGTMIALGGAMAETGAAASIAAAIDAVVPLDHPLVLVSAMLVLSVVLTAFVNNPSTVLVLAPVGIALAERADLPATPVIVAITVGASLDFLTPFGHHNNTLVMGIAGYRPADFLRFGWPLLLIAGVFAVAAITLFF